MLLKKGKIGTHLINVLIMIKEDIVIPKNATLIQALKQMDKVGHKMLFVFDNDKFYSIVTVGDLQRAIINNINLSNDISSIIDVKSKKYASEDDPIEEVKNMMLSMRAEYMPVIDDNGDLVKAYSWSELFGKETVEGKRVDINLPVVIMAGGRGSRLKPLTNVIPKPLIPIGEKTILETIMDQFESIGCRKFYLSVNYKDDVLKYYMSKLPHKYDMDFFKEAKPLGTIGSISLLRDKIFDSPFFVSNCDILIDQDMRDVYEYHKESKNEITVVTAVKSYKIPYGVIKTGAKGIVTSLSEKPEMTYMINTGVYILQPELIKEVPVNEFFHITQLIEQVRGRGGRVGCFPVSEGSWKDMGDWDEYLGMVRK